MPRYSDLIAQIPTGTFYSSQGSVVPNLDHKFPMRIDTKTPNDTFGVFVNNNYQFEIVTDVDGIAIFDVTLPKGENIVKLVNRYTQQPINTYLTVRDWATWLTAYADQLDKFDVDIETIKRNSRMLQVNYEMADPVWGRRLLNDDSTNYPIDTYREVLQAIQQGYRRFGGITGGLDEVVSAFTQVNPWMCTTTFGPRWVLGTNFVTNSHLVGYTYGLQTAWQDLNPAYPGTVTVESCKSFTPITTDSGVHMTLTWHDDTDPDPSLRRRFTFQDQVGSIGTSSRVPPTGVFNETIEARYAYTVTTSAPGPYNLSLHNWISLDFGQGQVNIVLPMGPAVSATDVAVAINTAVAADPRYAGASPATPIVGPPEYIMMWYPFTICPAVNSIGNAVNDASDIIFGVPWITGQTTGVLPASLPPPSSAPRVEIGVDVNICKFPTPSYPGAYNISVLYNTVAPATVTRLSLPVLELNRSAGTITCDFSAYLDLPSGNIYAGADIYPVWQSNYRFNGRTLTTKLTVNITDTSVMPPTTTITNKFMAMNNLPNPSLGDQASVGLDGWTFEQQGIPIESRYGWFSDSALLIYGSKASPWTISTIVDKNLHDWSGFIGEFGGWFSYIQAISSATATVSATIEFISNTDGTVSAYDAAISILPGGVAPVPINMPMVLPPTLAWDYAKLTFSLIDVSDNSTVLLRFDEAYVKIWTHTGLNLGFNTTPRNAERGLRGYMLYTWCPDPLSPAEKTLLGLPQYDISPPYVNTLDALRAIPITPSFGIQTYAVVDTKNIFIFDPAVGAYEADNGKTIIKPNNVTLDANGRWYLVAYPTGHISTVSPAQVTIDRFDISDGLNLVGVFTDTDFGLCSRVNLDIVPRSPLRFSYLSPVNISSVVGEEVTITDSDVPVPGSHLINLANVWDQDLTTVIVYEDAVDGRGPIPVTHDNLLAWGPQQIVLRNYNVSSKYTVNYERLTQVTTPPLMLPDTYEFYSWWADWVTFRILDMVPQTVPIYTGLQFDGNYYAELSIRSNMDVSQSLLTRNNGGNTTVVPSTQWQYINNNTIRLASQAFDSNSTYAIAYPGRVIHPEPIPHVKVEIRQGQSESELLLAPWETLPHYNISIKTVLNELSTPPLKYPWFQMRMSVSNIPDTRFIRVNSMMLKGSPVQLWGNQFISKCMKPYGYVSYTLRLASDATLYVTHIPASARYAQHVEFNPIISSADALAQVATFDNSGADALAHVSGDLHFSILSRISHSAGLWKLGSVITDGLLLYYNMPVSNRLMEGNGTILVDLSPNGNDGTLIESSTVNTRPIFAPPGQTANYYRNYLNQDPNAGVGLIPYITTPLNPYDYNSGTVSMWVSQYEDEGPFDPPLPDNRTIFTSLDSVTTLSNTANHTVFSTNAWMSPIPPKHYVARMYIDSSNYVQVVSNYAWVWNQYAYITMSWSVGGQLKLYINGVLEGSTALPSIYNMGGNALMFAGRHTNVVSQYSTLTYPLRGSPNEMHVYNRELDAAEVLANYTTSLQVDRYT